MSKYILHGGYTREENEFNRTFFEEFVKDIPNNGKILLVYFASKKEEDSKVSFESHTKILKERFQDKNLSVFMATQENFMVELAQADAVFFNGGSTDKLLTILKTYSDIKSHLKNKTVAGSSAGAYMLAVLGTSHDDESIREGLGLVPIKAICHFESPKHPPNLESVENLKNTRQDLELVYLKDCQWRVFSIQ